MNLIEAIIFGIIQGATEFLPVSSSGHLALAHYFLGAQESDLAFDVALHLGTLLAILAYFRDDFWQMGKAVLGLQQEPSETARLRKMTLFIAIATIPGALAGLLLGQAAENYFRHPALVATALAGAGVLLLLADRTGKRTRAFEKITLMNALLIGLSQACAIIPGVSRSGSTITCGLAMGLTRQAAIRFSFLLSAPIIFGAGMHEIPKIIKNGMVEGQTILYVAGFLAAAVSGYMFISFLMQYIRARSFAIFAYYRFLVAALVLIALFLQR
ncbi:undecaprenyl-diphosphatase UppP [Thiovibrio frasassiensis]|uniref:Undecaprenyl-diphosphatase n=1 Tax=Thiovibrio frasassiensis TaxID=2984131 RepID=A0A9X4RQ21_9BACT|nr:undecaprenyl-diphosphatase UppP [Thiovibrio frasassiensis]MDG4475822.1 undecaprenyl-diphosphatase UppP [Thiovibrio frasassiensis]